MSTSAKTRHFQPNDRPEQARQAYHDADVVSVVQRQGSVHLQQVVLCAEEARQVMRVEAHHHRDVVEAAERDKRILEYRLRPGVHFANF